MWSYSGMRPRFQWMICDSSATHGTDSSRRFHTRADSPTFAKDPVDLGERFLAVEPVERLSDDDRVDRSIGQRDRLGGALEDLDAGNGRLERGPHARNRLDRHDLDAERSEETRHLAGARREVEHALARAELQHLDQMRDRGVGVGGTAPLVGLGPGAESRCCRRVHAHARISVSSQISVPS